MNRLFRRPSAAWPKLRRSWFPAIVAACILLSPALAACGSASGFIGYDWLVLAISHDGTETSIPAQLRVSLQFGPDGQFGANDSVNTFSGTYRATGDGFRISFLGATGAGYAGHDPAVLLAVLAIRNFDNGVHATARLTGYQQLVVGIGSYTLTCQRAGPATPPPTPIPL